MAVLCVLNLLNRPLNRTVDLLLDLVQCRSAIKLLLQNFVSLQKLLKLIWKLKVLFRHHLHVPCQLLNLALLHMSFLLQTFCLLSQTITFVSAPCGFAFKLMQLLSSLVALKFKFVWPAHFILKCLSELRLCSGVLPVLVFVVADFFVHLPEFILKLLDSVVALSQLWVKSYDALVDLHKFFLLVVDLVTSQVNVLRVTSDCVLKLIVVCVSLNQVHSNLVKSLKLLVACTFLIVLLGVQMSYFWIDLFRLLLRSC